METHLKRLGDPFVTRSMAIRFTRLTESRHSTFSHERSQIHNKIDQREVFEPTRLSNPHLFSLKPLDTKPPLGRRYIVTTFPL